jgi:GNAT superfamily N-acetyltransferase
MALGEEFAISKLIETVFLEFIAPEYSEKGVKTFLSYTTPKGLKERSEGKSFILAAFCEDLPVGAIEIRDYFHISLFFVAKQFHRRRVGAGLWKAAQAICRDADRFPEKFTVNSSRYAIPVYKKLGFSESGSEETKDGITFTPMEWTG